MVNRKQLPRLVLDLATACLLLVALAYYWLDNLVHEWIGTGVFVLLIAHNLLNRRWYGSLPRKRREAPGVVDIALSMALLASVLVLLLTSLLISRSVFSFLPLDGGFTAAQIHAAAAYWLMVFAGIHIGLRWQRVLQAFRGTTSRPASIWHTWGLRLAAASLAAYGVYGAIALDIGAKLTLQMSLEWWDFDASTAGFFTAWVSVLGLFAWLSHYGFTWIQRRSRRHKPSLRRPTASSQDPTTPSHQGPTP